MSDIETAAQEADDQGQDHDLTTNDPEPARKIPIMEALETMPLIGDDLF